MSLRDGLLAHWSLNNVLTDDASAGLTLTNNGSATFTTGIGPYAQSCNLASASSQSLSRADHANVSFGSGRSGTITIWVKFTTLITAGILTQYDSSDGSKQAYSCYYDAGSSRFNWLGWNSGGTPSGPAANTFGAASTGVAYFLCLVFDDAADLAKISVNNGAFDTGSLTDIRDVNCAFRIGANTNGGGADGYANAVFGQTAIWNRVLTANEITALYNGGSGLKHPFTRGVGGRVFGGF